MIYWFRIDVVQYYVTSNSFLSSFVWLIVAVKYGHWRQKTKQHYTVQRWEWLAD